MNRLKDKVAFITGASTGIGRAAAILFANEGAKVVVADIDETQGFQTVHAINDNGGQAVYAMTDVTIPESVQNSIHKAVYEYGKLDILYNNAGGSIQNDGPITEVSIEIWERTFSRDLFGTFLCCKYGIPEIIKNGGGSVILTGSGVGLRAWLRSAYTAAKGGIISLTRLMATDYARYNIRVNCICPGIIVTERIGKRLELAPQNFAVIRPFHLLGFGKPIDVAYAALYFASDESRIVTGAVLPVDSGYAAVGRIDEKDLLKKGCDE